MSASTNGPAQAPILRHFGYQHLRDDLRQFSQQFHDFAVFLDATLPAGPETTVALRKLLEAKDAAVRARVAQLDEEAADAT